MTVMTSAEVFLGFINSRKWMFVQREKSILEMPISVFNLPTNWAWPMISIREIKRLVNDWNHQLIHTFHNLASLDDASLFYPMRRKYFFINILTYEELIDNPRCK